MLTLDVTRIRVLHAGDIRDQKLHCIMIAAAQSQIWLQGVIKEVIRMIVE